MKRLSGTKMLPDINFKKIIKKQKIMTTKEAILMELISQISINSLELNNMELRYENSTIIDYKDLYKFIELCNNKETPIREIIPNYKNNGEEIYVSSFLIKN